MFCSKCGKPIAEESRFCSNCGTAINYVAPRSTMPIENNQIKDGINIFFPDGHNEVGNALISMTEIIISERQSGFVGGVTASASVVGAYGLSLILDKLKKEKESLRISIGDIITGKQQRFRLNKNAYYITMKDGSTYVLIFDRPKTTIPYLDSLINANRG